MRAEILCNSLGGMPVPLITITENVQSFLPYGDLLALQTGLQPTLKKTFKMKYLQCRKLLK